MLPTHPRIEVSVEGVTSDYFPSVVHTAALLTAVIKLIAGMAAGRHIQVNYTRH